MSGKRAGKLARAAMVFTGAGILVVGSSSHAWAEFDTSVIDWAIGELCGHITGHLGSLLTSVAVTGALVAAAMGSYRVFYGAIMVAVGSFAVSTIMGLYFPEAANVCNGQGGGGGAGGGGTAAPGAAQFRTAPAQKFSPDPFGSAD